MLAPDPALSAYLTDIRRYPRLSPPETAIVAYSASQGSTTARNLLVASNLALVIHLAQDFTRAGAHLTDLICAGNLGLVYAAHHFNPQLNVPFSYYAAFWIKRELLHYFKTHRVLPTNPRSEAVDCSQDLDAVHTAAMLRTALDHLPTTEAAIIRKKLGIDTKQLDFPAIGRSMRRSKEWVRQRYHAGITRLRNSLQHTLLNSH